MNLNLDLAKKILHEIKTISDPQQRYGYIMENHEQFAAAFPIICKYMSLLLFNGDLFAEFLDILNKARPKYEERYKFQAEYVRKLMIKCGYNRMEAKKIYNIEIEESEKLIRRIKKQEEQIKRRNEKDKKINEVDVRQELLDFVRENSPSNVETEGSNIETEGSNTETEDSNIENN